MPTWIDRDETLAGAPLRGETRECELCREYRRCFDRFGIVACQPCQVELLPEKLLG